MHDIPSISSMHGCHDPEWAGLVSGFAAPGTLIAMSTCVNHSWVYSEHYEESLDDVSIIDDTWRRGSGWTNVLPHKIALVPACCLLKLVQISAQGVHLPSQNRAAGREDTTQGRRCCHARRLMRCGWSSGSSPTRHTSSWSCWPGAEVVKSSKNLWRSVLLLLLLGFVTGERQTGLSHVMASDEIAQESGMKIAKNS